ncbi:MAG: hypothetical protein ABI838_07950 [Chloroflexota bacterium]
MLGFADMESEGEGEGEGEADRPILADQASDPGALEGQWGTRDRDEAAHCVAVYQELIGVCRQLLETDPGSETYHRERVRARLHHFDGRQRFWLDVLRRPEPPSE